MNECLVFNKLPWILNNSPADGYSNIPNPFRESYK